MDKETDSVDKPHTYHRRQVDEFRFSEGTLNGFQRKLMHYVTLISASTLDGAKIGGFKCLFDSVVVLLQECHAE
jgi:hypothetical protein